MTRGTPTISAFVAEKLGNYVYLYIDPRTKQVFYVGKGKGQRALAHLEDAPNRRVAKMIREIEADGEVVDIHILQHALTAEQAAKGEAAAIDLFGLGSLANRVRGHGSRVHGRQRLGDLVRHYERREAVIEVPTVIIRIHKSYRPGMPDLDLYEATRGIWPVNPEVARRVTYALAVYKGTVMEAYKIADARGGGSAWFKAGTTAYFTRAEEMKRRDLGGRWEFVGTPVAGPIRDKLLGRVGRGWGGGIEYVWPKK